jgi:hypothetical protein
VTYSWEAAAAGPRPTIACGQTGEFNYQFSLGETASIEVGLSEKVSIAGGVSYTISEGIGNTVYITQLGFEWVGIPLVLQLTRESGSYTTSGGFGIGVLSALWRFAWHGAAGLLPRIEYKVEKTETIFIRSGWLICKRACP